MALLGRQTSISQWVPVFSQLVPLSPTQGQWGRMPSGTSQWPQLSQSLRCAMSGQIPGIDIQLRRKYHITSKLLAAKDSPQQIEEKVGAFTKIIEAMGFTGPLKYSKWKIKIAALRMYSSCVEKTDFEEFFLRCQLPDTFNSWFLITLLHVWMCLVRMKQEGRSGKYMCRIIVHFMWEDVQQRGRVMGVNPYVLKKNMILMTNNFYAAILGYDEALLAEPLDVHVPHHKNLTRRVLFRLLDSSVPLKLPVQWEFCPVLHQAPRVTLKRGKFGNMLIAWDIFLEVSVLLWPCAPKFLI
ncbi:ubiquinol-cytochrome-c reductase complex assembly factor 1 isoform X3 [Fukomys damarensis]|uniref:ubiquinol-cytochrome-c reductase complex assembly factor 1 isoform X3 n=1 Tax=Fukomys damarensis TaxID=885580 RepID=UPI00053F520C|nr:ubiquinol-cytochrome-c reductase complex assembly factor 1 isoform X3 [Fukomys damarensis]